LREDLLEISVELDGISDRISALDEQIEEMKENLDRRLKSIEIGVGMVMAIVALPYILKIFALIRALI